MMMALMLLLSVLPITKYFIFLLHVISLALLMQILRSRPYRRRCGDARFVRTGGTHVTSVSMLLLACALGGI